MRLVMLLLSDVHGKMSKVRALSRVERDLTVVAGDLSRYGSINEVREILKELVAQGGEVVWVPGNCDPPEALEMHFEGTINLHAKSARVRNLCFAGFGGSLYTPFNTLIEFGEEELREGLEKCLDDCREKPTVLVTHVPPYGSGLDRIRAGDYVGSRELRNLLAKYKPLILVSGHVHEGWGVALVEGVLAVNPGALAEGRYALAEVDPREKVIKVVLKRVG